jgi:hypothetical protein
MVDGDASNMSIRLNRASADRIEGASEEGEAGLEPSDSTPLRALRSDHLH